MGEIEHDYGVESRPRPVDPVRAKAEQQHGVVSRAQMLEMGISSRAINYRVGIGRLASIHRGVYAVGHDRLPRWGRYMAAVLAGGDGAVLGFQSAGALLDVVRWTGRPHVIVNRTRQGIKGVVFHRARDLHPEDTTEVEGIPCTTWARTLIDLATVLPHHQLVRALEHTVFQRLYDESTLLAAISRAHGHHGLKALNGALATGHHLSPQRTRSPLEDYFLEQARAADLTGYDMNVAFGDHEIDVYFPAHNLAIELDSRWHETVGAQQRDTAKDRALEAAGLTPRRIRKRDIPSTIAALKRLA